MPQLIANLLSGFLIELSIYSIAHTAVHRRGMMGNLFVAFAGIGRPHFMEAFEVLRTEDVSYGPDDSLQEVGVTFVRCKQVAATLGRELLGKLQSVTDTIIYRNSAWRRRTRVASFGAVLDVDLPVLLALTD